MYVTVLSMLHDEQMETQRDEVTYLRSHSKEAEPAVNPESSLY